MITIARDGDLVTLINVFSCEPQNQSRLMDSSICATEERLGKLPGIISAALHRSKDGTRVAKIRAMEERRELGKSFPHWQRVLVPGNEEVRKPDAHLYEVCYLLDKSDKQAR